MNALKIVYLVLGMVSLILGIIGIFLPLLPTTPFLLLAAWLFSKSSDRFHHWLMTHPRLGPPILDWQKDGVIRLPTKLLVTFMTLATLGISFCFYTLPSIPKIILPTVMVAVLIFIWTRPSHS